MIWFARVFIKFFDQCRIGHILTNPSHIGISHERGYCGDACVCSAVYVQPWDIAIELQKVIYTVVPYLARGRNHHNVQFAGKAHVCEPKQCLQRTSSDH